MRQEDSSDDEEHFRKKEQRRTERDTAKLRPLILSEHLSSLLLQALRVTTLQQLECMQRLYASALYIGNVFSTLLN